MSVNPAGHAGPPPAYVGRIPLRNLWLLMLYASELTRVRGACDTLFENDTEDLPDLAARLLAGTVERRLRRNLTHGYRHRDAVLHRVRGRIDVLATESQQLLSKGEVCCRFEELTVDTPRNRFVRAALDRIARLVSSRTLAHRCSSLAAGLARLGVGGTRPARADLAADQIGRNDRGDRLMLALARLAFDLALPTELAGPSPFFAPDREEVWARRLFEKAVLGMAGVALEPRGWSVRGSVPMGWPVVSASAGLAGILPRMVTDIVLDSPRSRRLVIDTKFTSVLTTGRFGAETLKSDYLYQMYAYLRTQEDRDPRWADASGLLLHPAIGGTVRERAVIQNHALTIATIDLAAPASSIRSDLTALLVSCCHV